MRKNRIDKMNEDYISQRLDMVKNQIQRRGIKDQSVLNAMQKVPRDLFVPENEKNYSYHDGPLPIGYGQTISQPYIVAYMTELLELEGDERILEIGTGCGYQTAILAEICKQVFTIEVVEELLNKARSLLKEQLDYSNIKFKNGNGKDGWNENAPFDRIIITAAPDRFPKKLFTQLKENGIAVAPIGSYFQKMVKFQKLNDRIIEESLIGVSFVPLV